MKKYFHVFLSLTLVLALALGVSAPALAAQGDSAPFTATFSGTRLTVSGDVDDTALKGALALVIAVFETESGDQVAMESCAVSNGSFDYTLSKTFDYNTTYTVKIADYAGGAYVSVEATSGSRPASPGGSPSTNTDTTITVPVTGETGGVQVEATISQGTATVGDISAEDVTKAVAEDAEPVSLVIDLSDTGKTVEKVVLSNDSFQNVTEAAKDEESGITGLTVKLTTADVEMDANTLTAVLDQAEGKDITIAVDETPVSDLNAKQKDAVKELTAPAIIDAYFLAGSKRIETLGGGKITITVPYVLTKGAAIVNYVDDGGKLEKMLCTYDAKAKTVSFETTHNSYYVVSTDDDPCVNFSDIDRELWYHEAIDYAIENGLMNGEGGGKFDPNGKLSRAMLCQIFYNKEGKPAVTAENPFTDVPAGQWYTDAVVWAYENEIVDGYGNGKFGPGDDITREQLATIIWRYDGKKVATASLDTFNDVGKISSYAVDALKWAYENKVVSGKGNGILDPIGNAQRCEVAQMLMNYLEK